MATEKNGVAGKVAAAAAAKPSASDNADTLNKAGQTAAANAAAVEQANKDAAANTIRLQQEAAEKRIAAEEEAAKKLAADTARAEEESARVVQEQEDARQDALRKAAEAAEEEAKNKIAVTVPRPFKLNIDNHRSVSYPAGTYGMPITHAEHWWAKANGVIPFTEIVEQVAKSNSDSSKNA